jgi:hypothetical protein
MGGGFEVGFLQDILGIDAPLQTLVEAKGDHAAQTVLMPFQKSGPGLLVSLRGPLNLCLRGTRIRRHGSRHMNIIALPGRSRTGENDNWLHNNCPELPGDRD